MRLQLNGQRVFAGTGSRPFDPDGPVLVLIHGAGMDHSVWVRVARHFARHGWAVLAPDLPGHGLSTGGPLRSIQEMALWLAGLLDQLNVKNAVLAGHSMGSLVAMSFAAANPQRCRALALLGTSLAMTVSEGLLSAARDLDHAAIDMANTWSHSPRGRLGACPDAGFWLLTCGERLLEAADPAVYYADLVACNSYRNPALEGEAPGLHCPVLVIAGEADQMTPARSGRALADSIPGAQFVSLAGCGHSMLGEQPNQVLDALRRFLAAN